MTRPLVLLLSSCLATTAAAQTLTATLTVGELDSYTVGPKDCGQNPGVQVQVNWDITAIPVVPCDAKLRLWVTTATCGKDPVDLILPEQTMNTTSGTALIPIDQLRATGDAGTICGSATNLQYRVCGAFNTPGSNFLTCTEVGTISSPPTLDYDGVAPDAPTIGSLSGVDNGLIVAVTPAADTSNIRLEYKLETEDDAAYREALTFSASANKATIEGLINSTVYSVRAIGIDDAKNESVPSAALAGAPVNSQGFFGYYTDRKGSEMGGCSTAGGVAILPAALLALWSILRRRRS